MLAVVWHPVKQKNTEHLASQDDQLAVQHPNLVAFS